MPPAQRPPDLPVQTVIPALDRALGARGVAVLQAPPGAGKTTLVPLALLAADWAAGRRIVLLEPRRLAARAAAARMADLLGEDVGETVGYRVRMDTRVGPRTRVEVVTEGVLTRMLQSDPALEGVAIAIFDEFHERSLHADLGLAFALEARAVLRPDLRLLVMSATLDTSPIAALLGDAPVVAAEGRRHPIETRFLDRPVDGWIEPVAAAAVRAALADEAGDVLVFLPGAAEIRRTATRLAEPPLPRGVDVVPLFGNLARAEQDRALASSPAGRRKVVLATSIAETSLTIEGVRLVVDAGLMRVPRFDPGTGMSRLETVRVTRDSADQRRGRAGRTAPGICHRLWTEAEDRGLVPRRTPEILEADLAPLALELAAWGAGDAARLRWLDPPPAAALAQARELLRELGALDGETRITDHGRALSELPLHPRLSHMLLRSRALDLLPLACDLAALLEDRDVLRGAGQAPDADVRLRVEALRGRHVPHAVDRGALSRARRASRRWRERLRAPEPPPGDVAETGTLLALAYPDRVGRRRTGGRGRYVLRNGRGARLAEPQPLEAEDWIVATSLDARGPEARIFLAAPVPVACVEALFAEQVVDRRDVEWDEDAGRARAFRRRALGALVLEERQVELGPGDGAAALLAAVRRTGLHTLPWTKESAQLRDRIRFLHALEPGRWPDVSDDALAATADEWLLPFLAGMSSLDQLRRLDLREALIARVGWQRRAEIDRLAPERIEVPSGSRIRVDYSDPQAPALAARLQELFGLSGSPGIADGRVPVTIALLSPALRTVQVTRDLASFWRDAYFEVRKELRGRYPRHYWPEDPLAAPAIRGVRPREG